MNNLLCLLESEFILNTDWKAEDKYSGKGDHIAFNDRRQYVKVLF